MLDTSLRILNFDDSVVNQHALLGNYKNTVLDLKGLGLKARFWMNKKTRDLIAGRIQNSGKNAITFLGSGDFHQISEILISQFQEPLSVIVFDFHPDWDTSIPRFGCGSWVTQVINKDNVAKIILLGVSSEDISSYSVHSGNLASLKDNRVEIYPYAHSPSKTFLKKIPDNISIGLKRGRFFNTIYWQELYNKNLKDFFRQILSRIPTKKVYLSIDKDCLRNEYALTNWEEGKMPLDELLLLLGLIKDNLDIIGLDIVGDYSEIRLEGLIKNIASYFDHPRNLKTPETQKDIITSVNENTNLKLLELLTR